MFIVEYFIKTENYVTVQCAFHEKFKLKRYDSVPLCVTISKLVKIFRETSAATPVGAMGRKRSLQIAENCEKLQAIVEAALRTSLR